MSKVSKTPGKTKMINFFEISTGYRLVDLPGYGYAKVSKEIKYNWNSDINTYLLYSSCLIGLVIFMDIRHVVKELDKKFLNFFCRKNIFLCIVLTKSDKLNLIVQKNKINILNKYLSCFNFKIDIIVFSIFKNIGSDQLKKKINSWFKSS